MDPLATYQRLQALKERRAVSTTTCRHIHLSERPLVVAAYHLAGEVGAPLAVMWGTDPDPAAADFVAVAEPRNRKLRFEALERFGSALDAYLRPLWTRYEQRRVTRQGDVKITEMSHDAPQLVVPNAATAAWLFGVVGRFTRYLRTDGDDSAPESVRRLGQNLTFFDQTSRLPGSCVALAATDVLGNHFVTGQLDGEMQNLAAVLGWVVPDPGLDGPETAKQAEKKPPAGPLPDPNWDAGTLEDLIRRHHAAPDDRRREQADAEIARQAREQLEPAWLDTWRALAVMRSLPEAAHVPDRWLDDRRDWAYHTGRMDRGEAFFRRRLTPLQGAQTIARAEDRVRDLDAQMALDDPAVMLRAVARGEAVEGVVTEVDPMRREIINGKNAIRPSLCIETDMPFMGGVGTELYLASEPEVKAEIRAVGTVGDRQRLTFRVVAGALTAPTRHRLPRVGTRAILSPYGKSSFFPATLPKQAPWTHVMPETTGADS